jgi:hypothetical protein
LRAKKKPDESSGLKREHTHKLYNQRGNNCISSTHR